MKQKYHYVYVAYTDNLCFGRMKIGEASTFKEADSIGFNAGKGCYTVRRERRTA